jgi:hypothetical protein
MVIQLIACQAGGWLFVITDEMGELLHSEGVFNTIREADDAAENRLKTL